MTSWQEALGILVQSNEPLAIIDCPERRLAAEVLMRALCDAIGDVEIAGYTAQNANESLKQQIDRTIKEATRFITIGEAFEDWAGIISSDTEALRKHFIKLIKITKKGFFKYRMSQDQFRNKNSVAGQ